MAASTVTKKDFANALAKRHHLTKKRDLEMLDDLIGLITQHLKKGERVKIAGLGILVVRNRAARMGRNPMTGEAIQIKASKKVAFRPTKALAWQPDRWGRAVFSSWSLCPRRRNHIQRSGRQARYAARVVRQNVSVTAAMLSPASSTSEAAMAKSSIGLILTADCPKETGPRNE